MVRAEFKRREDGAICLEMKGHSTYKEQGQLIVCAGISAVFYTLLGYLQNTFGARLRVYKLKPGDTHIECSKPGEEAFRMACIGLIQLGELYPTEISVENKVWDSRLCRSCGFDISIIDFEENIYE